MVKKTNTVEVEVEVDVDGWLRCQITPLSTCTGDTEL